MGSFLPALTARAFGKYGFSASNVVTDWPAIVGGEFATVAAPERLIWPRGDRWAHQDARAHSMRTGATLVLRVDAARALEIQYATRQIIERVNAYFGYSAIANLRIVQAPHVAQRPAAVKRAARPLVDEIVGIGDTTLREALAKLGGQVQAHRDSRPQRATLDF